MIKNVIIVNDFSFPNGGSSEVAVATANLLADRGINVLFFCGIKKDGSKALRGSIEIINCEDKTSIESKKVFKGLYNGHAKRRFKNILASFSPLDTVIHFHSVSSCLTYSVVDLALKTKFRCVLTAHDYFLSCPNGSLYNFKKKKNCQLKPGSFRCAICNCDSRNYIFKLYRNLQFFLYKHVLMIPKRLQKVIYVSNTCRSFNSDHLKAPNKREIVLLNPIIVKKAEFQKNVQDYFVYVGRMHQLKGVDILCDCFKTNGAKLILFGDGPELEKYKQRFGSCDNIVFRGWTRKEELMPLIKNARAMIVPSTCYETGPLTVFEALSIGLIPIVSEYCAAKDFLVEQKVGYIYNPYDLKQLNDILSRIGTSNRVLDESKACYDAFWNNYLDLNDYTQYLLNFYEDDANS